VRQSGCASPSSGECRKTPQSLGEFHARSCVGHAEAAACEDRGVNLRVKLREAVRELVGLAVDDERAVPIGEPYKGAGGA